MTRPTPQTTTAAVLLLAAAASSAPVFAQTNETAPPAAPGVNLDAPPAAPVAAARSTAPDAAPASTLPVRDVVLFTSGVSYIQREGDVTGDATVPLTFRTAQINDILKSLILLDEGGRVQPAVYNSRDPIGRTLQSFAVDVTENLSQADILAKLRGARVSVDTTNKGQITGQIVSVEEREEKAQKEGAAATITVPYLTILDDKGGLTTIRLDAEKTVRLLDARLNREFREALGILASGADDQRRQVTLRFEGNGRRRVRVGYVTEAPLWKMSYRLVLGGTNRVGGAAPANQPPTAGGRPYLQGWALVENTTDEDWNGVRLSLVSGRPISFIQDLYQPLYIPRPVIPPDVVASPFPQTHGGDLQDENKRKADVEQAGEEPSNQPQESAGKRVRAPARSVSAPAAPVAGAMGGGMMAESTNVNGNANLMLRNSFRASVEAQAQGQSAGELFQYNITTPVSLPRQQAAMIPVIAQDISADKVSLFNPDTEGGRFPLNAVRIKNNTGLHLKGGPVTLFDDGAYAGDARMEDVPPGDTRLVSYAVDLAVEGERQGQGTTTTETSLSLRRGVLIVTRRERQSTTYTLKSKAEKVRTVLVEHPFQPDFKLITPAKADERSGQFYRFAVSLAPGKSETLKVVTERPISQTLGLIDTDINSLGFYATKTEVAPRIREALQEVVRRRRTVQELQQQAANREAEINSIGQDQERIRKNMAALDKNSALYKRYVAQLDSQETRIQGLRNDVARLRAQAAGADRDLRAFVDKLDLSSE